MAKDVITRFKLETTGFDSKIKEAAKELSAYSKTATQAKEGFNQFTKANVDAARALGTIATSSTNAKDRAKELVGAFNDAAKAYNALTKEQQQSDWAKALAGSLTQLQQRIKETKAEMQGLGDGMNGVRGGSLLSKLGGKMEGALAVFGGNMLTKAAGAVASLGSEMVDMVQQGVEMAKAGEGVRIAFERLGRGDILDGLREATHGTVTDLELMKAAVKFNDFKLPVEELGTMLAFAQQKAKDTGQSVDYMVDSIVTGLGRKSLMILDNLGLSATEVKEKMKETGDMTKAVGAIIREQMAKAGDYVETAADRAAQANVSLQNKMEELGRKFAPLQEASDNFWTSMKIGIMDVIGGPLANLLNKLTEAGRMANAYGLMGGNAKVGRMTSNLEGASAGNRQSVYNQQVSEFKKYISPREQQIKDIRAWQSGQRGEALQGRIGAITAKYGSLDATKIQAEIDAAKKMLADYQQAAQKILKPIEQKIIPTFDSSTGGTTGGGGKSGNETMQTELQQNQAEISKLTQEFVRLGDSETEASRQRQAEIQKEIELLKQRNGLLGLRAEQAQGRLTLGAGDFQRDGLSNNGLFGNSFAADDKAMDTKGSLGLQLDPSVLKAAKKDSQNYIDQLVNGAKDSEKAWGMAGQAVQGIGAAFAMIDDPAAKAAGTVLQAVASIALGFATASASPAVTSTGWGWLAWVGAGAAALATTIATIHSLTGYAQGGIVDGSAGGFVTGSSFSGDNIGNVRLNSGELVLNKAQTNNLANALEGGGMHGMNLSAKVQGEDIILVIDRTTRRMGRGELLTWR